jgi:hypothetical protein
MILIVRNTAIETLAMVMNDILTVIQKLCTSFTKAYFGVNLIVSS